MSMSACAKQVKFLAVKFCPLALQIYVKLLIYTTCSLLIPCMYSGVGMEGEHGTPASSTQEEREW